MANNRYRADNQAAIANLIINKDQVFFDDDDKTQVLLVVVGGALTGLSSGVFLAAHGVRRVSSSSNATPICYNTSSRLRAPSTRAWSSCIARSDWSLPSAGGKLCEQRSVHAFAPIRAETLAEEE
jgi:hypothetical protein